MLRVSRSKLENMHIPFPPPNRPPSGTTAAPWRALLAASLFSRCTALFCLLFLLSNQQLQAQQLAQYSLYMLDPAQLNPAYAGLDNSLSITAAYRSQWVSLPGSPLSQRISAHLPIKIISSGIGFNAEIDALGARRYSRFGVDYNFQLVRRRSVWSLGVNARMNQLQLDGSLLRTGAGQYDEPNILLHNDDLLPTSLINNQQLSFGAGLYYQGEKLEGGFSVLHLNMPAIELNDIDWVLKSQYNVFLRAQLDAFGAWRLLPSALIRSDGIQTQVDISALLQHENTIFFGASFRGYNESSRDAVILLGGLNVSPQISLAYAYDLTLSGLRDVQTGSHEIVLKYNLGKPIGEGLPPPIIYFPRTKE